jgi:hypothetical protein
MFPTFSKERHENGTKANSFVAKKTMIKKQEYLARWAEYNPRQKTCDLKSKMAHQIFEL